jgi:hypothetical protein
VAGAGRVGHEDAGRVIADPVVEGAVEHEQLLGAGLVEVDAVPDRASVQLQHQRRAVMRAAPQRTDPYPRG